MEQTALNLIAIGVFLITLFSLLGPILNISPFIPAAITLGIMGIATIDTLGLENRGATLLLDSLSPTKHRQRVIHHEAGHFLAAYFLGIPIAGYTLTAWEAFRHKQPGLGGVIFDTTISNDRATQNESSDLSFLSAKPTPWEMQLQIERFCTVLMAGIAAEDIVYGNAEGGAEDLQKVRTILLSAGFSDKEFQQKESWAKLQATSLLKKNQQSYHALVEAMTNRASVPECYQIIQHNCQEETKSEIKLT